MALPVTVVVRRTAKSGREGEFDAAMRQFIDFALAFPGNHGINVLRPPGSGSREYTVVDRFASQPARDAFKASPEYQAWMSRLADLTERGPYIEEQSGLGGWFTPPAGLCPMPPPRMKMALVTFIGVYPLTATLPPLMKWLLPTWHPLLTNVIVTGLIIAALTWVVMPLLTRILASWLFPK